MDAKPPPPHRRQHAARQRNSPPINGRSRFAQPRFHLAHLGLRRNLSGPQYRILDCQHPAHRPQNPCGLRGRLQQLDHLWLFQNVPQLAAIPRRLIPSHPHQPGKPPRPNPRAGLCNTSYASLHPRLPPPKQPRLNPHRQTLNFPTNLTDPPIQQHHHRVAQQPPQMPAAHLAAQCAQHRRQAQIWGRGTA